jgi:hypothetical protein
MLMRAVSEGFGKKTKRKRKAGRAKSTPNIGPQTLFTVNS